jgi:hypothetical protein
MNNSGLKIQHDFFSPNFSRQTIQAEFFGMNYSAEKKRLKNKAEYLFKAW